MKDKKKLLKLIKEVQEVLLKNTIREPIIKRSSYIRRILRKRWRAQGLDL